MDWFSISLILAGGCVLAALAFWAFAAGQKKAGRQAGGPAYSLFAWLAFACAVFFVFLAFATFELKVIQ